MFPSGHYFIERNGSARCEVGGYGLDPDPEEVGRRSVDAICRKPIKKKIRAGRYRASYHKLKTLEINSTYCGIYHIKIKF